MAGGGADGARGSIASRARLVRSRRRRGVQARSSRDRRRLHRQGCAQARIAMALSRLSRTSPCSRRSVARFRGEAVALVVGDSETMRHLDLATFPVTWSPRPALTTLEEALEEGAERIHSHRARNILTTGRVARGDVAAGLAEADIVVEGVFRDRFRRARLYRARGGLCSPRRRPHRDPGLHAGALYGSRRRCEDPRNRARAGAHQFRRRSAAASARSSICRSSPSSRSLLGGSIGRSAWFIRAANRS